MEIMRPSIGQVIDFPEPVRSHKREVYGHEKSHQRLVGADVARRLLPADMLFACLEGKDKRAFPVSICCSPHYSPRQFAHKVLAACKEAGIRSAETQRDTESLCISACDVCTPFSRSLQDSKRGWVTVYGKQCPGCMYCISIA